MCGGSQILTHSAGNISWNKNFKIPSNCPFQLEHVLHKHKKKYEEWEPKLCW